MKKPMKLTTILESTEAAFLEIAVRAVSILSPVPTAFLVYDRTIKYLQWPDAIAGVAAAVVEGFGFSSIHICLTLIQYNQTKRQKDPTAPTWIAVALITFYILSVVSLTIMLDTFPEFARFATILFPAFSLCGAGLLVLRYNHANRLQAIASQKEKEREERKRRKEEVKSVDILPKEVKSVDILPKEVKLVDTRTKVLDFYRINPLAKQAQVAKAAGVSPQYISQLLKELERDEIIHRNGHGVEIIKQSEIQETP